MKWNSKEIDTLIDVIGIAKGKKNSRLRDYFFREKILTNKNSLDNSFPGLFTHSLPTNCWSADSKRVIINTTWRSETVKENLFVSSIIKQFIFIVLKYNILK